MNTVSLSQDPPKSLTSIRIHSNTEITVVAADILYLAKQILTTHDQNILRIGPQMKSALVEMDVSSQLGYTNDLAMLSK